MGGQQWESGRMNVSSAPKFQKFAVDLKYLRPSRQSLFWSFLFVSSNEMLLHDRDLSLTSYAFMIPTETEQHCYLIKDTL